MGEANAARSNCTKHGQGNPEARAAIDVYLRGLPQNQGGEGRHTCAYCAFEVGRQAGYQQAKLDTLERLKSLLYIDGRA